jgi:crotonobetainyl-CoA:carnitine CoA-transferase CaiB-like acyl-CoA transferase
MLAQALSGLTVLDFTQIFAGPISTMMLADLGAEVVKVESPEGDLARALSPWRGGESLAYMSVNRNKRSVVLNLKDTAHLEVARTLAARADVLVESFRPGVMQRLGLGYQELAAANPRLVYCSVSAYGQEGSARDLPGVDGVLQAVTGLMSISGVPGGDPAKVGLPVVDVTTGQQATIAILAALAAREKTGHGQHLDVSLFASAIALQHGGFTNHLTTGELPQRHGHAAPYATPNEALRCKDGWMMVAAYHPARWRALCAAIGAAALADDPRFAEAKARLAHRADMVRALEERMLENTRAHWIEKFLAVDIICGPINDYAEVVRSDPFQEAQFAETLEHSKAGKLTLPRSTLAAVGERPRARRPPPTLGEHTQEVLAEFGCDRDFAPSMARA